MSRAEPPVSVGLPVYNGEALLPSALDALLAQDYGDFELVIADNASTDATAALCREYAARDSRIRYVRNDSNIGATGNFNRVAALARGRLFAWAGHDDSWAPSYLGRLVERLEARPDAVLAHTWVRLVDMQGALYPFDARDFLEDDDDVVERFRSCVQDLWSPIAVYGLIRRDVLSRTGGLRQSLAGDRILLCELALHGPFLAVPELLHTYRLTAFTLGKSYAARNRNELRGRGRLLAGLAPWLSLEAAYLELVARADVAPGQRLRMAAHALRWYAVDSLGLPAARRALVGLVGDERFDRLRLRLREQAWYRAFRRIDDENDFTR